MAGANCDYNAEVLRVSLSSPLSPWTVLDVSLKGSSEAGGAVTLCAGGQAGMPGDGNGGHKGRGQWGGGGKTVTVLRQRECKGFRSQDYVCRCVGICTFVLVKQYK